MEKHNSLDFVIGEKIHDVFNIYISNSDKCKIWNLVQNKG